jgi:hypothetical protein
MPNHCSLESPAATTASSTPTLCGWMHSQVPQRTRPSGLPANTPFRTPSEHALPDSQRTRPSGLPANRHFQYILPPRARYVSLTHGLASALLPEFVPCLHCQPVPSTSSSTLPMWFQMTTSRPLVALGLWDCGATVVLVRRAPSTSTGSWCWCSFACFGTTVTTTSLHYYCYQWYKH